MWCTLDRTPVRIKHRARFGPTPTRTLSRVNGSRRRRPDPRTPTERAGSRGLLALGIVSGAVILAVGGCVYTVNRSMNHMFDGLDCLGWSSTTRLDPTAVGRPALWSAPLPADPTSAPVLAGGLVLERTGDGSLSAFDAATGARVWSVDVGRAPLLGLDFAPVVVGDTAYLTDWSGTVQALDVATSASRWTAPLGASDSRRHRTPDDTLEGGRPLAVDDTTVYAAGARLVALDRSSGATRWSAPISFGYSQPVRVDDAVVVGSERNVTAFDARTGASRWVDHVRVRPTDDAPLAGRRVAQGEGVLVTTGTERFGLRMLDSRSGTFVRGVSVGELNLFGSVPVVDGQTAYVRGSALYAIDTATGNTLWSTDIGGPATFDFAPAALTPTLVITPGGDGRLHAIDRADGAERWAVGRRPHGKCKESGAAIAPAVDGTRMIVASGDGHLYAYPVELGAQPSGSRAISR